VGTEDSVILIVDDDGMTDDRYIGSSWAKDIDVPPNRGSMLGGV
jgi:hypothetical protein